jgi:uncharacterized OsmC-like protein
MILAQGPAPADEESGGVGGQDVMLQYHVNARRVDSHGSEAMCKEARLSLDTDPKGRADAFNPAELFLAAVAACMIKNIERVAPLLRLEIPAVDVSVHGVREEKPPKLVSVTYEIIVDTDADDRKLELLHQNVRRYGTIYNTVAAAARMEGRIVRSQNRSPRGS